MSLQDNPFFQQLQLTPEEIVASKLNQPIQSRRQLADIIAQSYMAWRSQQLQKIQEYKSELKSEISKEEEETIKRASGESILEWFERLPPEVKAELYKLAPAKTEFYQWLQKNPNFRLQVYAMYKDIVLEQYLKQLPERVEPSQVENWLETLGKDESRLLMAISGSPEYKPPIIVGGSGETKIGLTGKAAPIINIPEQASGITQQSFVAGKGGVLAVIPRIPIEKTLTEQLLQIPTTSELEIPKQALAGVTAAFETATLGLLPTYPTPPTIFKAGFELARGKSETLEYLKTHPAYTIGEAVGEVLTALAFTKLLPKPTVKETIAIKPEAISEAKIPAFAGGMEVERAMQVRIRAADLPMQSNLESIIGYSGKTLMVREAGLLGPTETILGRTIKTGEEAQKLISGVLGEKPTMKVTITSPEFIETYWRMPSGIALGEVRSQAVELTRSITGKLSPIDKVKLLLGLDVEKTIIERAVQFAEKPQPQLLTVTETKISGLLVRGPEPVEKAFKVFVAGGGKTETVTMQEAMKTVSEIPVKIEFKLPSGIAAGAITLSAAAMPHTIPSMMGREISETELSMQTQPPEITQPLKINFKIPLKIELPKLEMPRSTLEKPIEDLAPKTGPQKSLLSFPEIEPPKITPQLQPKLEAKTREPTSTIEQEIPKINLKIQLPEIVVPKPKSMERTTFTTKLPSPSIPPISMKPFHIPFNFGLGSQKMKRGKRKRKTKKKRKYREYVNPFPELNEAIKGIEKALKSLKIKF